MKKILIFLAILLAPIFITNAQVTFPNHGGTGTSTIPTYGKILLGNSGGTYSVVSTSSLGIGNAASPDRSIQFNCNGVFCGNSNLTWGSSNDTLFASGTINLIQNLGAFSDKSVIVGNHNTLGTQGDTVLYGYSNTAPLGCDSSAIFGYGNLCQAGTDGMLMVGFNNDLSSLNNQQDAAMFGVSNAIPPSLSFQPNRVMAFGSSNSIAGTDSQVYGNANTVPDGGSTRFVYGYNTTNSLDSSADFGFSGTKVTVTSGLVSTNSKLNVGNSGNSVITGNSANFAAIGTNNSLFLLTAPPSTPFLGSDNIFAGVGSGASASFNTAANICIGKQSCAALTGVASSNVTMGASSLNQLTTGKYNVCLGVNCGYSTLTGTGNILAGIGATATTSSASYFMNLGNVLYGTGLYTDVTLGNATSVPTTNGRVGVSTSTPGSIFSIGNTGGINFTLATTSFSTTGGINVASGCYAIAGTCLISGSSSGGGSSSKWSTTTNGVALTPNGGTSIGVVLGRAATTTNSLLEVNGTTTATVFVATSTTNASTFPYASTTMITAVTASSTDKFVSSLGTNAGTFVASDAQGKLIATTSPVGPGILGQTSYYAANGSRLTATSTIVINVTSKVGIGGISAPSSRLHVASGAIQANVTTSAVDYATRENTLVFSRSDLPTQYLNTISNSMSGTSANNVMSFGVTDSAGTTQRILTLNGDKTIGFLDTVVLSSPINDFRISVPGNNGVFRMLPYQDDIYFDNNYPGDVIFRTNASGGGTEGFRLKNTTSYVGMSTTTPDSTLTVFGTTTTNILRGAARSGTIVLGAGAGTLPTYALDPNANNLGFTLTVTTGTLPTGTGAAIATYTFPFPYSAPPHCGLTPANSLAAALSGVTGIFGTSTKSTYVLDSGTTALTAATTYIWTVSGCSQ